MRKIWYMLNEALYMVKRHKLYILMPIFLILIFLALLFFYMGPSIIISFFYAGL